MLQGDHGPVAYRNIILQPVQLLRAAERLMQEIMSPERRGVRFPNCRDMVLSELRGQSLTQNGVKV